MSYLRKSEEGFTLVEMMIVVLIIGVLVAIATPVYMGITNRARTKEMQADLRSGLMAVEMYYMENGEFTDDPDHLEPMEPAVVYYTPEQPVGTVALRLGQDPENSEVCLFGQAIGGDWYAVYRNADDAILYGEAELQDCSGELAADWSPHLW